MKQTDAGLDEDGTTGGPLRCWFRVAMGMAGACALAAQAVLELSALEAPVPVYAAQPVPARDAAQGCGAIACPVRTTIDAKG